MEDTDLDGLSDWSEISKPKKRNDNITKPMPGPYNEDDDYENGGARMKQENGIVKRQSPRQSAQEAAEKLKRNFVVGETGDSCNTGWL